ncbi:MAG: DUF1801 domain-containing protein [Flavobacteriales bacterium]|jgi:uncharacterized protein YdhG (YjbR/CyaY superfamily)|nr:DUF1801 domain-containing protein [Flavobacteriales bacterium]MBK6549075.1 DUF1801 domain-containing protein [Flavobacteriales bacterium]MBK6884335.1 DUF1801 domain-containing protein [Flavobacteriales bacterium]MBK7100730.1 DUF1801 domain-containing protein [Flavobacteriales bacterium]MBK7111420.1 DUF1801 domain-containing protein [Flavobacteriales bacterium]
MRSRAQNVTEYFNTLPDDRREEMLAVRKLIKGTWKDVVEDMDLGKPTYHLDGHALWSLANQKNWMVLYVKPHDLLNAFKKDLLIYDTGRSCIRFKRLSEQTLDLFDRIIKYTGNQMAESELLGISKRRKALQQK